MESEEEDSEKNAVFGLELLRVLVLSFGLTVSTSLDALPCSSADDPENIPKEKLTILRRVVERRNYRENVLTGQ